MRLGIPFLASFGLSVVLVACGSVDTVPGAGTGGGPSGAAGTSAGRGGTAGSAGATGSGGSAGGTAGAGGSAGGTGGAGTGGDGGSAGATGGAVAGGRGGGVAGGGGAGAGGTGGALGVGGAAGAGGAAGGSGTTGTGGGAGSGGSAGGTTGTGGVAGTGGSAGGTTGTGGVAGTGGSAGTGGATGTGGVAGTGGSGGAGTGGTFVCPAGSAGGAGFTPGRSCTGLPATCGPNGNENCCASSLVPCGTFTRSNGRYGNYRASVSEFRLDRFEITIGRFRAFAAAWTAGYRPGAGQGKNPNDAADPGYQGGGLNLANVMTCLGSQWTSGTSDNLPMSCMTWEEAFTFCIWDGGRLPTEAEWNYAAAGGSEQRPYPWSLSTADESLDATYANYASGSILPVGSKSPKGDGRWGHADLAGGVGELMRDWYNSYTALPAPCINCANLDRPMTSQERVNRGGDYRQSNDVHTWARYAVLGTNSSMERYLDLGARCARAP